VIRSESLARIPFGVFASGSKRLTASCIENTVFPTAKEHVKLFLSMVSSDVCRSQLPKRLEDALLQGQVGHEASLFHDTGLMGIIWLSVGHRKKISMPGEAAGEGFFIPSSIAINEVKLTTFVQRHEIFAQK
jgi:hypothetical protein